MPSNKRQKELARRRAERQAARRAAERARRRRRRAIMGATIGGVAAAIVAVFFLVAALRDDDKKGTDPAAEGPKVCDTATPEPPKKQTFKKPEQAIDAKKNNYRAIIDTSCGGAITFELFDDKAPETANSLAFLASKDFYDRTFCHRMTASPTLTVLQCGDPEGTGAGGPGYTLKEENLKGAKYPRGTVAMAKTNAPNSTGSQFFLVAQDSQLPPQYTVIGKMDEASLTVLDKIMGVGIQGGATDGAPNEKIYLTDFRVEPVKK